MGWSPLMWAVSNEHTAVALYLIEFGAKLRLQDFDGRSALHMACSNGQVKVVHVSVHALGAHVRVPLKLTKQMFVYSVMCKSWGGGLRSLALSFQVVEALMAKNIPTDPVDKYGDLPLLLAAKKGNRDIAMVRAKGRGGERGFGSDSRGRKRGRVSLTLCGWVTYVIADSRLISFMQVLIKAKCDVNVRSRYGESGKLPVIVLWAKYSSNDHCDSDINRMSKSKSESKSKRKSKSCY